MISHNQRQPDVQQTRSARSPEARPQPRQAPEETAEGPAACRRVVAPDNATRHSPMLSDQKPARPRPSSALIRVIHHLGRRPRDALWAAPTQGGARGLVPVVPMRRASRP